MLGEGGTQGEREMERRTVREGESEGERERERETPWKGGLEQKGAVQPVRMIASELYRKGERKQPASRVYLFPVVLGLHSKIDAFKLTLKTCNSAQLLNHTSCIEEDNRRSVKMNKVEWIDECVYMQQKWKIEMNLSFQPTKEETTTPRRLLLLLLLR